MEKNLPVAITEHSRKICSLHNMAHMQEVFGMCGLLSDINVGDFMNYFGH